MSKENVKKLFGEIEKDIELQKKYASLMQSQQKEIEKKLLEKLVEFGQTSGFAFSKDDLISARTELMDKVNSNRELSDGDLANVAGGASHSKICAVVGSIGTLGIACAVGSITLEIQNRGSCGKNMTTQNC